MSSLHQNQDYSNDDENDEYDDNDYNDEPSDDKIKTLSDLSNSSFLNIIHESTHFLTSEDAPAYFKIVLGHFKNTNLQTEYGKEILITIRKLIHKNDIFEVFKAKKVILKLPFIYKNYNDEVYAIIYDVLNLDPSILDETFCDKDHFENSVKEDPHKALSIIGNYARKVVDESIEQPWNLLDILIKYSSSFIIPGLVEPYVAILCYLCKEVEDFANAKIKSVWDLLVEHTKKTDIVCHKSIYLGLSNLLDINPSDGQDIELALPMEALKNDIKQKITQDVALNFIYYFAESDEKNANKLLNTELFSTLFSLANDNVKNAAIILMTLANKNSLLANEILNNQSGRWMLDPLPDFSYTLRIFMTIFSYENLRNQITKMKQFVPFLNLCLKHFSSAGIITIITAIIRRIKLDDDLVSQLIDKKFIQKYIKEVDKNQDESNLTFHSLLLLINALSKFNCGEQFLEVIPTIKKLLDDDNLSEIASYAAADLSSNEECMNKMLELKVQRFFKEHLKDPKSKALRHNARRFFRNKKNM